MNPTQILLKNPKLAKQILSELASRATGYNLSDPLFVKQDAFINSKASLVAGFCTRRAGKSYGAGLKLYQTALKYAGTTSVYISLTRDSAKRIMLKDVMKVINRKYDIGAVFNHTELSITLPNGSIIYLLGMDSDKREMDKVLGQKFKLAIIDEAGSFRQDLREIVYSKLKPACADLRGQIYLIGTPQNFTKGLFYDVVWTQTEPGWEVHKWSAFDNLYMADVWQREIDEMVSVNPRVVETPWFKQNYLGQYVVDTEALCYRYRPDVNLVKSSTVSKFDFYVLGIDLGYEDATAFSLLGYNDKGGKLYVVHTSKEKHLTLTQVASRINWYQDRYAPYKMIVDNAAKQAVEEIKQRFTLPLVAADKAGKADFIEIMNNDFVAGNILISDACSDLTVEYENLIWDDNSAKKQEHPNCDNHLCFVAGTMVQTPSGEKRIEQLQVGDLVETRKGPRRIQNSMRRKAYVLTITLTNGQSLTCTPDHPFWSNGRWIQAQYLTPQDQLLSWSEVQDQRELYLRIINIIDQLIKNTSMQDVENPLKYYTENYGKNTTEKFKKGTIYTTRIITHLITGFLTLNAYRQEIINSSTLWKKVRGVSLKKTLEGLKGLGLSQKSGINQMRVGNGTGNTPKTVYHSLRLSVLGVVQSIQNLIWQKTNRVVVQTNVLQQKEERAELTTLISNAIGAKEPLKQINMRSESVAVISAPVFLENPEYVYNITVDDEHEYFAGGILTGNCDATLYAYRYCYQYIKGVAKVVKKSDVEKVLAWEENIFNKKEETTQWWEKV